MNKIFMETTIQADKFLGKDEKKKFILNTCKGKELISSTYVLGEFKSNFLKDAVGLYNLVYDSKDLGEALIRFEEYYSKRVNNRMSKLLGNLISEFEVYEKEEVLDRLEIFIEDTLIRRFKRGIDKFLVDNTKCIRCLAKPEKRDGVWKIDVRCRKSPKPKCNINDFLISDNINDMQKLMDLPSDFNKVTNIIDKVINNLDKPYGNNCRTLGDTIIALEAPNDSAIFTTNKKDYEPICTIIGKNTV